MFCLMLCLATITGCGHAQDLTILTEEIPSETGGEGEVENKPMSGDIYAATVLNGLAKDMLTTGEKIVSSLGFSELLPDSQSSIITEYNILSPIQRDETYRTEDVVIKKIDTEGNSMSASGKIIFLRQNSGHCAIYSQLDVEYDGYIVDSAKTVTGTGRARMIITSYACKFYEDFGADIVLQGQFTSGDQSFDEVLFSINFEPSKGIEKIVDSAEVAYPDGIFYCGQLFGHISCFTADLRPAIDYCGPDLEACEMTDEGHASCSGHCDLGCCSPLPIEDNVCIEDAFAYRDCNPAVDTLFTADYLLWGKDLVNYQVPVRCSDDGIWTPPCPLDGSESVCPYGSICVPPDDEGWGVGLEDYGYCSCTPESQR